MLRLGYTPDPPSQEIIRPPESGEPIFLDRLAHCESMESMVRYWQGCPCAQTEKAALTVHDQREPKTCCPVQPLLVACSSAGPSRFESLYSLRHYTFLMKSYLGGVS